MPSDVLEGHGRLNLAMVELRSSLSQSLYDDVNFKLEIW
jgi:hypothetical protein